MTVPFRIFTFLFAGLIGASCAMSSVPETRGIRVQCSVAGSKWLGDSLTDDAICARFVARLGLPDHAVSTVTGAPMTGDGLTIALRFERLGRAIADVTRTTGGVAETVPANEVVVMDRPLALTDVDTLADNVAAALGSESQS